MGSTGIQLSYSTRGPNHSHVCGINHRPHKGNICILESFPRMWDQPALSNVVIVFLRIIPTYVGSTTRSCLGSHSCSNHSHVCGINGQLSAESICGCESFPRMWDQHYIHDVIYKIFRIIPTYVGSTIKLCYDTHQWPNHSHVCGINQDRH